MKLIFYATNDFPGLLNLPVRVINHEYNRFFRLGRTDKAASPPVPSGVLNDIPKDSEILYDIFSLDCCLESSGKVEAEKISESEALIRAAHRKIYNDDFSCSAYFRYADDYGQHTVWVEDTTHTIRKLKILERLGFDRVGVLINDISADTVINLIHADCCSI